MTYGVAAVYHETDLNPPRERTPAVHIKDRTANMEDMMLAFTVEKSMAFSTVGMKIAFLVYIFH